jgi:membrane fusion protein (multidrug efflux system)
VFAHAGHFKDLGLGVDQTTGTIKVQGLFPNPGGVLRPGQFVRVRAVTQNLANATLVPQRAIVDQQGTNVVAIVAGTDGFTMKPVKTGPLVGSDQVILEGVAPGDKVIVDGLSRLRPGEKIVAKPAAAKPAAAVPSGAATPATPKAAPQPMKSDTPGK